MCGDQIKEEDGVGGNYSSIGTYEKCTQNFRVVSKANDKCTHSFRVVSKQKLRSLGRKRHKRER
jgi:hypothetical protein